MTPEGLTTSAKELLRHSVVCVLCSWLPAALCSCSSSGYSCLARVRPRCRSSVPLRFSAPCLTIGRPSPWQLLLWSLLGAPCRLLRRGRSGGQLQGRTAEAFGLGS